ncbi:uncharacterized protein LOC113389706 [Ctenocephalides felis]|uniref:uncharacterized protein LOC113389706 n=1 Tax=Ctenocephalides felis TaxID=7515 RepID=UPI000E6E1965|nr:uncharacterized protein LOC113389706 [Ctenocephalides felis]
MATSRQIDVPRMERLVTTSPKRSRKRIAEKMENIKDNFTKALKTKRPKGQQWNVKKRRKYIYFDLLAFLLTTDVKKENNEEPEEPDDIPCDALMEMPVETQLDENVQFLDPQMPIIHREADEISYNQNHNLNRRRKRRVPYRPLEERLIKLLDKKQEDTVKSSEDLLDEDKAFFVSLLPSVKRLSDEQRMDFRLDVLNCLKRLHYQKPHEMHSIKESGSSSRKRGSHSNRNQEPSSSNNHAKTGEDYS